MATAVPAAESVAPSPAPAAAAPVSGGAGDPLEALRQETIAWGHQGNKPSEPAPVEPNSTVPPTPAEGSTPPIEAAAPTAQPSNAHEDWIKRYGSPEKAAQEAFALEQRASAMAKRLKDLETAQPAPAPTATQPAVQPVATQPTPTPQAQPANTEPAPTIEEQGLRNALDTDAQCRDLIGKFNANQADLQKLTAEEIPALQKQIAQAQAVIDHPEVDELVKDNARAALAKAELTLTAREAKAEKLELQNRRLDMDFRARVGGHVDALRQYEAERAREAEFEKEAETKAQDFVKHWPSAFDQEFVKQALDPEMREEVHKFVKTEALARPGRIDLQDLPAFMAETIKDYATQVDKHHRIQARKYALQKTADVAPAAPTGDAAAIPLPQTEDPMDALRQMTRAAFRAKGARP